MIKDNICACGKGFSGISGRSNLSRHGRTCRIYQERKANNQTLNVNVKNQRNSTQRNVPVINTEDRERYFVKNMVIQIIDNVVMMHDKVPGMIYLVREREFIFRDLPIYKIGKTRQPMNSRLVGYPKGTQLILSILSDKPEIDESELKLLFTQQYNRRLDIGTEYFEGNPYKMISHIINKVVPQC